MSRRVDTDHRPASIRELIDRMAQVRSGALFLIDPESGLTLSYHQLHQRTAGLSRQLLALGLRKGDRVAFMLENGLFTAELFLGALYGGLVPVPVPPHVGPAHGAHILTHSGARVLFQSEAGNGRTVPASAFSSSVRVIHAQPDRGPVSPLPKAPEDCALPPVADDDEALLCYTSGSTGVPKGVPVTQRGLLAGAMCTVQAHRLGPEDRTLCVLPLYHMNAQVVSLLPTLATGGSVVLPARFSAEHFWEWVEQHQCTWLSLVPTIVAQLLDRGRLASSEPGYCANVRFARCSSAPLSPFHHQSFEQTFEVPLLEALGVTEAVAAVFSNPLPPAPRKAGSVGLPYGFDVRIQGPEGRIMPPGECGEIVIRGPSIMRGYYRDPVATEHVLDRDGWLRTGDIGYLDEDGYCFVIGRAKELIIKGGVNIAPREIDDVLQRHPAVLEAVAVGVPDSYLGEEIVAAVLLRDGAPCSERELLDHCEAALGSFRSPCRIHFVADLPRGPSGKVQRLKLREWLEAAPRAGAGTVGERPEPDRPTDLAVAPASPAAGLIEETLRSIWISVLGYDGVGLHDSFFALGGHSLRATQAMARVRALFGVEFSFSVFFEAPTIAEQAHYILQCLTEVAASVTAERFRQTPGAEGPPPRHV